MLLWDIFLEILSVADVLLETEKLGQGSDILSILLSVDLVVLGFGVRVHFMESLLHSVVGVLESVFSILLLLVEPVGDLVQPLDFHLQVVRLGLETFDIVRSLLVALLV